MKLQLLTLAFAMVSLPSFSQRTVPSWEWVELAYASGYAYNTQLQLDEEGNIFYGFSYQGGFEIGGKSVLNNQRDEDPGFYKLNPEGRTEWAQELHSSGSDYTRSLCVDKKGQSYLIIRISGTMRIGGNNYSSANGSYVLVAYKTNGLFRWAKQMNLSSVGGLHVNSNGELAFTGSYYQTFRWAGVDYSQKGYSSFLAAIDDKGNPKWLKEICENSSSIVPLTEGKDAYYFSAIPRKDTVRFYNDDFEILPSDTTFYQFIALSKDDMSIKWTKKISSTNDERIPLSLGWPKVNSSDDVYLVGYTADNLVVDNKKYPTKGKSRSCPDGFIIKLSKDGNVDDVAILGLDITCDFVYDLAVGPDDWVYITGTSSSTIKFREQKIDISEGGTYLMKLDKDLQPEWNIVAHGESNSSDLSMSVEVNRKNDLVVMGTFHTDEITFGDTTLYYSKLSGANQRKFIAKVTNDFPESAEKPVSGSFNVSIYPNPGNGHFVISATGLQHDAAVRVRDCQGKLVHEFLYAAGSTAPLTVTGPNGVYIVEVESSGVKSTQRYVKF